MQDLFHSLASCSPPSCCSILYYRVMDVVDFVVETTETDVMPYLHSKCCAKLLSDALREYLVDGSIDSVHREEGILILRIIVKLIKVHFDFKACHPTSSYELLKHS